MCKLRATKGLIKFSNRIGSLSNEKFRFQTHIRKPEILHDVLIWTYSDTDNNIIGIIRTMHAHFPFLELERIPPEETKTI